MGRVQPISLAQMIVQKREMVTISSTLPSCAASAYLTVLKKRMRMKLTVVRAMATRMPTRNSRQRTLNQLLSSISPTAIPRMTSVLACEPQLPPVSISMGMKAARIAAWLIRFWQRPMMAPVNVAEIIRTRSQTILFRARRKMLVFRYSSSDGFRAAIFSKSSVFSASMTSTISSMVMMPTMRSSLSTTGMAFKS